MASPASGGCAQAPTSGWVGLRLVRSPALSRPHTQLGLQPRNHQPSQRRTTRRPLQDEQVRMHPPRHTHPTTRPTTPPNLQHPTRRRRKRPPRRRKPHHHNTTQPTHAMAQLTQTHCGTTRYAHQTPCATTKYNTHNQHQTRCSTPGYPPKISKGRGSTSRDVCHDYFFSASGLLSVAMGFVVWYGVNCVVLQWFSRFVVRECGLVSTVFAGARRG